MQNSNIQFLYWLVDRLVFVYKESPQTDFVLKLRRLANELENAEKAKKDVSSTV